MSDVIPRVGDNRGVDMFVSAMECHSLELFIVAVLHTCVDAARKHNNHDICCDDDMPY